MRRVLLVAAALMGIVVAATVILGVLGVLAALILVGRG